MTKAHDGYNMWHGNKRNPMQGKLNIPTVRTGWWEGEVFEIVYLSTKWENSYDPYIKRLLGAEISGNLHKDERPQPYHHTFNRHRPPSLYSDEHQYKGQRKTSLPRVPSEIFCLGTLSRLRVEDPILDPDNKKSSCHWKKSALPLILGSLEPTFNNLLICFYPEEQEIGFVTGGIFRVTKRGLVG